MQAGIMPNSIQYDTGSMSAFLDAGKYNAVFYGEHHNTTFDPEIKYHLIKHLNSSYGFRHVFMEVGISAAWRYTQYLNTGDTSWLVNPTLVMTKGGYGFFWKRLYEYNQLLPDSQRVIIHGIDFERTEIFSTLLMLSGQDSIPPSLIAINDTLKAHMNDSPLVIYTIRQGKLALLNDEVPFNKTIQYIRKAFEKNEVASKAYFGKNYQLAMYMLHNPGVAMLYPKPRNKTMAMLMQNVLEKERVTKFIGFFGHTHTDYSVATALTNFIAKQQNYKHSTTLTIMEVVKDDNEGLSQPGCKAIITPAAAIPALKRKADFLLITNNGNKE